MSTGKFELCLKNRNIGKFRVNATLVKNNPDTVQSVLSKVLIIEATNHFINDEIHYSGYNECFEPVDYGQMIPNYDLIVDDSDKENLRITFKRV